MKNKNYTLIFIAIAFLTVFLGYSFQEKRSSQLAESSQKHQTVDVSEETQTQENQRMYVIKNGDNIKIRNKYTENQDVQVNWGRNGANDLFDYQSISFADNTEEYVSDSAVFAQAHTSSTDFFGPHKVLALNNVDGDYSGETEFTGGNHAFSGGSKGSPTAETENIKLFVNGEEQSGFEGYAETIQITWTNFVQGSNTKKTDGSGREVIEENYKLDFDGETYTVNNSIKFLEDAEWESYYGLQAYYGDFWNDDIIFNDGSEKIFDSEENNQSQNKETNQIMLRKDSNVLEIGIDSEIGIGNREYLNDTSSGAFNIANTKKAYFQLVDGGMFSEGDIVEFNGYYRFYSE